MNVNRTIVAGIKLLLVLLILLGVYRLWKAVPTLVAVPDDDDIAVKPRITVSAGVVHRGTLHGYRWLETTVEPRPARGLKPSARAVVSAPFAGLANEVFCREGQHVQVGQPLFSMDDREARIGIDRAKQMLLSASAARLTTAEAVKNGNVPPRDSIRADGAQTAAQADLAAAQARMKLLTIAAPIAGIVVRLNTVAGQGVGPWVVSVELVDFNQLTAAALAPAWTLSTVSVGDPAELGNASATTRPVMSVTSIDPSVDPATGLGQIDIDLPAGAGIRPGEALRLRVTTEEHRDVLVAPAESVAVDARGRPAVSGIERDFRWAYRHGVDLGLRDNGLVEISGPGIVDGMNIVTRGAQSLPDASQIEVMP